MMISFANIVQLLTVAAAVAPSDAAWRLGRQERKLELELPDKMKAATGADTMLSEKVKALQEAKQIGVGTTWFDPERDDPWWPGVYPTSFGDDLIINIALDNFPSEMSINVATVLSPASETERQSTTKQSKAQPTTTTTRSYDVKSLETKQVGDAEYSSLALDDVDTRGSLYRIEIVDLAADGICCNYGNGWITITDRDRNVLWSIVGNYTFVATAYIELDSFGNYALDSATHGTAASSAPAPPPTPGQPTGPTNPSPTPPPVSPPVSPPTTGTCTLCLNGASVGLPFKIFELSDGTEVSCGDIEDVYDTLDADECDEFDEGGATSLYRYYCECPGFEPACELCFGGVGDPDKELTFDDGTSTTCRALENSFIQFTQSECDEFDTAGTTDALADFCEC